MTKTIRTRSYNASAATEFTDFTSLIKAMDHVKSQKGQFDIIMPDGTEYVDIEWCQVISKLKTLNPWCCPSKQQVSTIQFPPDFGRKTG